MALQRIYPAAWPPVWQFQNNLGFSSQVIDATGEKFAFMGPVRWNDTTDLSKDITKVHFRFGTVTKSGGSALTVSLQNVDTTAGPPFRPDGTQDQTVAIANANASFASNTWIQTAAFSADRTVTFGDLVAVVVEFDGSGRLSSDSVGISYPASGDGGGAFASYTNGNALFTASWSAVTGNVGVLIEFSDGTFGTLGDGLPLSSATNNAFNSGSSPNEYADKFTVPFACEVCGMVARLYTASGANFDLILYQDNGASPTVLASVSIDQNTVRSTSAGLNATGLFATPVTLTPGTTYYRSVKPTTVNNITLSSLEFNNNAHLGALWGGTSEVMATRAGGAWTPVTTSRLMTALLLSGLDDGVQVGGGSSAHVIGG